AGWTPTIALVTKDQIYTATFTEEAKSTSDYKQDLNTIFEFNISALLPEMVVNDYQIFDDSDDEMIAVYLYVFNWDLEDALAYMDLLDLELTYDSIEDAWVLGDYFLYVFDDDIEFGELFYGIGIYGYLEDGTDPGDPVEGTPFDKNELNALFGFDIYELMPDFASNSSLISDYSDETVIDVYIDIFDWTEADALAYMDLLDANLTYDESNEVWILGDFFIYVFADDETYPGQMVYGIG